jgi:hypothetical protein
MCHNNIGPASIYFGFQNQNTERFERIDDLFLGFNIQYSIFKSFKM